MHAIQQNPGVRRLTVNPLLLRILALIHRTGAKLPQKRIELYKLAADTLASTWRQAQGVSSAALVKESALLKEDYLIPLLSKLAYWLHANKPTAMATESEVYEVLGEEWAHLDSLPWNSEEPSPKIIEEIRKFLVAVREHTGLLVERAPRRYGFMHLTFEEYFAARYLVAHSRVRARRLRQHLHQARWQEPILLALGFVGLDYPDEASELVETAILAAGEEARELGFMLSEYEDLLGRDFLFALDCLGDTIPMRQRLLERLCERLVSEVLFNKGAARFELYRQALNNRLLPLGRSNGSLFLLSQFKTALQDGNVSVRRQAADSLGRLGQATPEVVAALCQALQDDNISVRRQAAESLGRLGQATPEVVAALRRALQDINVGVSSRVAISLGQLGQVTPEVVAVLRHALEHSDAAVRYLAIESLGQLGQATPEVVAALRQALQHSDAGVRYRAVESLGQLGRATPEVIAVLCQALQDSDAIMRRQAAEVLGRLGQATPEVVAALRRALQDSDMSVSYRAAESLVRLNQVTQEVVTALRQALQYGNTMVRYLAVENLGQLGQATPEVITLLLQEALQHSDPSVRYQAVESLGQLGQATPEVVAALQRAMHSDATTRRQAAKSLAQIGQIVPGVITELRGTLFERGNTATRIETARILGKLGQVDKATLDALWRGLLDKDSDVNRECARALAQLGKRDSTLAQSLEQRFVQAIQDASSPHPDLSPRISSPDAAYEGLWMLVSNQERESG